MSEGWKFLIENTPVAVALIIMTKMWLSHLKAVDERTQETFKKVSDDAEKRAASCAEVIKDNTEILAAVKQVIQDCCK